MAFDRKQHRPGEKFIARLQGVPHAIETSTDSSGLRLHVGDSDLLVTSAMVSGGRVSLLVNDRPIEARIHPAGPGQFMVEWRGRRFSVELAHALSSRTPRSSSATRTRTRASGPANVVAPMPGTVVQVLVRDGDRISAGQSLFILEAMKMQNEVNAPGDGTVRRVHARAGQTVDAHQLLCEIES